MQLFKLKTMPIYGLPEFNPSGQPYYNMIKDPSRLRVYYKNNELNNLVFKPPYPNYELCHNLYADGVMLIASKKDDQLFYGLGTLEAFINSKLDENETLGENLGSSITNVFTDALLKSTIYSDQNANQDMFKEMALDVFKSYTVLGFLLQSMCQQHFKPRCGVVIDNFIQYKNCRRLVEGNPFLTRANLDELIKKLPSNNGKSVMEVAIDAATEENNMIDHNQQYAREVSDIDQIANDPISKFPNLNGSAYRHPGAKRKKGSSLCSDYFKKDRWFSDIVESLNHALGVDSHRLMILSGCPNGAALLASLMVKKDMLFQKKYSEIASAINSGLCLSLLHFRNIPVAFAGSLEYTDLTP